MPLYKSTGTSSVSTVSGSLVTTVSADQATYMASLTSFTSAAGVAVEIRGSATTTVSITDIVLNLGASDTITVTMQSANSTGGTSSSLTLVPLDSNNAAATNSVLTYTAAPTPGTAVGDIAEVTGTSLTLSFAEGNRQPIVLNAAAEAVSISLASGTTVTGYVKWTEA